MPPQQNLWGVSGLGGALRGCLSLIARSEARDSRRGAGADRLPRESRPQSAGASAPGRAQRAVGPIAVQARQERSPGRSTSWSLERYKPIGGKIHPQTCRKTQINYQDLRRSATVSRSFKAQRLQCCDTVRPENSARRFRGPAPVLRNPRVLRLLAAPDCRTVLEVGAGCLRNALFLQARGHRMWAFEVPQTQLRFPAEYRRFQARGGVVLGSLDKIQRKFDVCLCTFVVETICRPAARRKLLRKMHELLREGGCLIMSVRGRRDVVTAQRHGKRCGDGYVTPLLTFVRPYTREELDQLLRTVGFTSVLHLHRRTTSEPELLHVIADRL
jgi:SAM-dependent methyltransferase